MLFLLSVTLLASAMCGTHYESTERARSRRSTEQLQHSSTHHEAPTWDSCMCTVEAAWVVQLDALDRDLGRYHVGGVCPDQRVAEVHRDPRPVSPRAC